MPIIVYVDVANVNDERTVNALEHVRVQLWLNVTHRTRLSVTFSINHVDNTVVLHCLNISNVSDGDSLASHATTNQEHIGRVQTLALCFHFCSHNKNLFEHLTIDAKVLQTMKTGSTKPPYSHIIHLTGIKTR